MKSNSSAAQPEDSGFAVFTINKSLNFDDMLMKVRKMIMSPSDNVWLNLTGITKTDFTATSVYVLSNFVKKHEVSFARGKVVVVADTDLSYVIAKTTLSLLGIDGFRGQVQLFSSRKAALRWIKLVDLLSSS